MTMTMIGLDTAKTAFQVHGIDASGQAALKRKLHRSELVAFFEQQPPCTVFLEACGAGHHWGRLLSGLGHEVKLIAPEAVRPFVKKGRKNDAADAAALCVKSGNAVILRGGKEAARSNAALHHLLAGELTAHDLPADAVQLVPTPDRAAVPAADSPASPAPTTTTSHLMFSSFVISTSCPTRRWRRPFRDKTVRRSCGALRSAR